MAASSSLTLKRVERRKCLSKAPRNSEHNLCQLRDINIHSGLGKRVISHNFALYKSKLMTQYVTTFNPYFQIPVHPCSGMVRYGKRYLQLAVSTAFPTDIPPVAHS